MVLVGFAESLPRATNRLTLDPVRIDAHGAPLLKVDFTHGENERRALQDAQVQARAMLEQASGHFLFGGAEPGNGGSAIHEMGGARMGHDPATSVLNKWSQAHDVANVFVTDGAQMASSACQNPSLTYMALTARAANHAASLLREHVI
jgi:choline dehydrogenase-like flavoprotein